MDHNQPRGLEKLSMQDDRDRAGQERGLIELLDLFLDTATIER